MAIIIPVPLIVAGNARRLGDSFRKNGVTSKDKAVTI